MFPKNGVNHSSSQSIIVNDCPYWTSCRYLHDKYLNDRHFKLVIAVNYDARSNKFKLLPEFHFDVSVREKSYAFHYKFTDMRDCCALMVHD